MMASDVTPDALNPARLMLDDLPASPGVYLYRDRSGKVIYVGKAKSLRSRVRSYFQGASGGEPKTDALLSEIQGLEYIVTRTEVEALILENSLIKKEKPRYNIRLRDDKNFPYLKMTTTERFPRVVLVRRARLDGNAYFGPYLPASAARRTIHMVARHFKVATCYEDLDGRCDQRLYGLSSNSFFITGVKLSICPEISEASDWISVCFLACEN